MSGTAHVRALFKALLHLREEDAELPLQVLVNLHRPQLRAPMVRLSQVRAHDQFAALTTTVGDLLDSQLSDRYPLLYGGRLWSEDGAYMAALRDHSSRRLTMTNSHLGRLLADEDYNLRELIVRANDDFKPYEPLVQLYLLTLPTDRFEAHLELLELSLAAHPMAQDMALAVATEY